MCCLNYCYLVSLSVMQNVFHVKCKKKMHQFKTLYDFLLCMNQLDDLLVSEIFVSVASTVQRYKARCVKKMWWERCGRQVVSSTVHSDRWACSYGSSVSSISHNRHRSVTQATLFKSKLCKRKNSNTHTQTNKTVPLNKMFHYMVENDAWGDFTERWKL